MITGTGVHDRPDWPFTITGIRNVLTHAVLTPYVLNETLPIITIASSKGGPGKDADAQVFIHVPFGVDVVQLARVPA
jgi:hypothetical protein